MHFEQIQGYASRCLLGSLCPLVYGAAEWFSNSGDVHDLHHAELCSRATAEILFFCVFISTVPQSKKLKIKHRFISGKIIHKCRVLNCNVWLSEGSHPEAHSIRFWITFLKLDYGIWWMSLKNMHYSYFRMTANIIYFHSSVHSPCGFEPKVWNTPFYGSIHEQNDGKP